MTSRSVQHVVVAGSGTNAFLAAATLRRLLPGLQVTLLHDPSAPPPDPVGESTTPAVLQHLCAALGLQGNPKNRYTLIDPFKSSNVQDFLGLCQRVGVDARFVAESDLTCPLIETDLLFIDTWHVYAQLKRELTRWHSSVSKFIILHDTTIDAVKGESAQNGLNIDKQRQDSGFPADEIAKGLWPAVEDFLDSTPDWSLDLRLENNSGLTILRRRGLSEDGPMTPIPRTQG